MPHEKAVTVLSALRHPDAQVRRIGLDEQFVQRHGLCQPAFGFGVRWSPGRRCRCKFRADSPLGVRRAAEACSTPGRSASGLPSARRPLTQCSGIASKSAMQSPLGGIVRFAQVRSPPAGALRRPGAACRFQRGALLFARGGGIPVIIQPDFANGRNAGGGATAAAVPAIPRKTVKVSSTAGGFGGVDANRGEQARVGGSQRKRGFEQVNAQDQDARPGRPCQARSSTAARSGAKCARFRWQ